MTKALHPWTVVTGAASGIGRSVVDHLLAQSTPVIALDKNAASLSAMAESYPGHALRCHQVDLTDASRIEAIFAPLFDAGEQVQGLAHCAGVWSGGSILETQEDAWDHLLQNNLLAARNICAQVSPGMKRAQSGSIVIVSSNAARLPRLDMSAYCVSKAALRMYAKCLALELAAHKVRCNIVSPGATQTPMQANYQAYMAQTHPDTRFRIPAPLEGSSTPEDIAQAIAFLLSEAASSITMADLCADRGATLGV